MIKETTEKVLEVNLPEEPQLEVDLLSEKEQEKEFYNLPTGTATNTIMLALGSGSELNQLPARRKQVSHSQKIGILKSENKRQITVASKDSTVTLELSDIEKIAGKNVPAKKIFNYSLIKLAEQAYSNGGLKRDFIQFPLKDLIDIGFYNSPRTARRGFDSAMDVLTSMKIKGSMQKGKKKTISQSAIEVLFTGANRDNGTCTIYLNERINWGFVAQYYTIIPKYYFALPNKASDLLFYVFYAARQRLNDIEKKGYFTISMRSVHERLHLPSEMSTKNPERDIKKPIEDAITAIEDANNNPNFTITPFYNNSASVTDFLNRGYLKVELAGEYATLFRNLYKKKTKQIETAKKRKESITEKAIAINLAKKLDDNKDGS